MSDNENMTVENDVEISMTEEEIAREREASMQSVRHVLEQINSQERDRKLSESDWIVAYSIEKGTEIPAEWIEYRQALRDIKKHEKWPVLKDQDWPTKPE